MTRKEWLWDALKDVPEVNQQILDNLTRPPLPKHRPWELQDTYTKGKHFPRRNGPDVRCTPDEYHGVLIAHR